MMMIVLSFVFLRSFALVLVLCLVILSSIGSSITTADGMRLKEGCYDAGPITCDKHYKDDEIDFDLDQVCKRIIFELLPLDVWFMFETHEHAQYLNSVEASEEFCSQIRRAYSRCFFCMDNYVEHEGLGAIYLEEFPRCGGLPSLEEILEDNENYTDFKTQEDIDRTCQRLEETNTPLMPEQGAYGPGTIELAVKKVQISHLCPGYCDGGCFDSVEYPPSCDPDVFPGPYNDTLDPFQVCEDYILPGFIHATVEITMNISQHVDYLRFIPGDTNECDMARQAYSSCVFCAERLCFAEPYQPSCEAPTDEALIQQDREIDNEAADYLCWKIYEHLYGPEDNVFNISDHAHSILMGNNNPLCADVRSIYHRCYWCAPDPHEDFCLWGTLCEGNVTIPDGFENHLIPKLQDNETTLNCSMAYERWEATWVDPFLLQICYEHIDLHQRCPKEFCELEDAKNFDTDYLGTTNTAQRRALIWISRVSALLSFGGACYILQDILFDYQLRKNVYHQLLTGMAVFDIITALAWSFATAPIDAADNEGYYVEGASGTEQTCKAQAFFIQWGFTSIFYNVSLGVYYALVVAYGWREFQLKKIRLWMHILPNALGLGLALGALGSYHWFEYGCHILPTNDIPVLVFVVLPLGLSIAAITACMFVVYWKVRTQAAASKKWSLGVGKASKLEQAVFWQCLCYVFAFYISWPILFAVYLFSIDQNGPFGLAVTVAFVAPLQGFNNFLVYIRGKRQRGQDRHRRNSSSMFRQTVDTMWRMFNPRSTIHSLSASVQSHGTRRQHHDTLTDPSVAIAMDEYEQDANNVATTAAAEAPQPPPPPPIEEATESPEAALEETIRSIKGLRAESNWSLRMKSLSSFADDSSSNEAIEEKVETVDDKLGSVSALKEEAAALEAIPAAIDNKPASENHRERLPSTDDWKDEETVDDKPGSVSASKEEAALEAKPAAIDNTLVSENHLERLPSTDDWKDDETVDDKLGSVSASQEEAALEAKAAATDNKSVSENHGERLLSSDDWKDDEPVGRVSRL